MFGTLHIASAGKEKGRKWPEFIENPKGIKDPDNPDDRAHSACDTCRARKLRCMRTANQEACVRCLANSYQCNFTIKSRSRRKQQRSKTDDPTRNNETTSGASQNRPEVRSREISPPSASDEVVRPKSPSPRDQVTDEDSDHDISMASPSMVCNDTATFQQFLEDCITGQDLDNDSGLGQTTLPTKDLSAMQSISPRDMSTSQWFMPDSLDPLGSTSLPSSLTTPLTNFDFLNNLDFPPLELDDSNRSHSNSSVRASTRRTSSLSSITNLEGTCSCLLSGLNLLERLDMGPVHIDVDSIGATLTRHKEIVRCSQSILCCIDCPNRVYCMTLLAITADKLVAVSEKMVESFKTYICGRNNAEAPTMMPGLTNPSGNEPPTDLTLPLGNFSIETASEHICVIASLILLQLKQHLVHLSELSKELDRTCREAQAHRLRIVEQRLQAMCNEMAGLLT